MHIDRRILALLLALLLPSAALGESLDTLFSALPSFAEETAETMKDDGVLPVSTITMTFGGDAVIGIRENWWKRETALPAYLAAGGMGYPFSTLKPIFEQDDLTWVNLECTLKSNARGEKKNKEYRFRGLPEWTQVITASSIETVNIANNHVIDYGTDGFESTKQALDAAEIPYSGYGEYYVFEKDGHRIGFAGCRETTYFEDDKDVIAKDVAELRSRGCDVIIYSCHWGTEYETMHNRDQIVMAKAAAEAGVDILIGTHPHVVQGVGYVDGMLVLWSLGNLMFGGTIKMTTFDGMLARLTLEFAGDRYDGCHLELLPVLTSSHAPEGVNDYCPTLAAGEDYERIMQQVQEDTNFSLNTELYFPAR